MPKVTVTITWDEPDYKEWLCPENIKSALSAYCKNTKFMVEEVISTEEQIQPIVRDKN